MDSLIEADIKDTFNEKQPDIMFAVFCVLYDGLTLNVLFKRHCVVAKLSLNGDQKKKKI